MNYLNSRIGYFEDKLKQTQSYLTQQEEEYTELIGKVSEVRNRYCRLAMLLTEFIESMVELDPEILQRQDDIYLNIDDM
jgi:hypothetical protein